MQKGARGRIWAKTGIFCDGTGPPGFEPGFEAPEASVMSKLYYGPARPLGASGRRVRSFRLRDGRGVHAEAAFPLPFAGGGDFDSE